MAVGAGGNVSRRMESSGPERSGMAVLGRAGRFARIVRELGCRGSGGHAVVDPWHFRHEPDGRIFGGHEDPGAAFPENVAVDAGRSVDARYKGAPAAARARLGIPSAGGTCGD